MGFTFTNTVSDPFDFSTSAGGSAINFVAMETEDDVYQIGTGGLVLGVTLLTYMVDDGYFPDDGVTADNQDPVTKQAVPMSGGQIIKADIVIDADLHRSETAGVDPVADLMSTLVHEIGHFIGLDHTPLNNLDFANGTDSYLVESPAISLWDSTGQLVNVGVTPTMFPVYFLVDDGVNDLFGGWQNLAPDDIGGASYLYPRADQDDFFSIVHWARTQTRTDLPSLPLGGGHVVAWVDTDEDPVSPRVPLVSTMTGLYESADLYQNRGRFYLYGLPKEIDSINGSTFPGDVHVVA